MIPPIFEGATVIIVAGGPSLRGFDFGRLTDRNVIAINRAYETCPAATLLWWTDHKFWMAHREGLTDHLAPWKATAAVNRADFQAYPAWVHCYRFTGMSGFDDRPDCLRHGNNSAYTAMHLAVKLGARKLILLGVDMRHGASGETHWHSGHGLLHQERTLTEKMLPFFANLVGPLAARGVTVVNGSPESALTLWPRCTIDEALA